MAALFDAAEFGYFPALFFFACGLGLARWIYKAKRGIFIIRPDAIGMGFVGTPLEWTPREEIDHVAVLRGLVRLHVALYRPDGTIARSIRYFFFHPWALDLALSEAGIAVVHGHKADGHDGRRSAGR